MEEEKSIEDQNTEDRFKRMYGISDDVYKKLNPHPIPPPPLLPDLS